MNTNRSVNIERNQCKVCGSERHFYPDEIVCDTCESNRYAEIHHSACHINNNWRLGCNCNGGKTIPR